MESKDRQRAEEELLRLEQTSGLDQVSEHSDRLLQDKSYWEWRPDDTVVHHRFDYHRPRVDLTASRSENRSAYLSVSQLEALALIDSDRRLQAYGDVLTASQFALIEAYEQLYYPEIVGHKLSQSVAEFCDSPQVKKLLRGRLKRRFLENKLERHLGKPRQKLAMLAGTLTLFVAGFLSYETADPETGGLAAVSAAMFPDNLNTLIIDQPPSEEVEPLLIELVAKSTVDEDPPLAFVIPTTPPIDNSANSATPASTAEAKIEEPANLSADLTTQPAESSTLAAGQLGLGAIDFEFTTAKLSALANGDLKEPASLVEPASSQELVSAESEVDLAETLNYASDSEKEALMIAAGISEADWPYVDYIIDHESNWRPFIWNQQGSSAYGLCQTMMSLYEHEVEDDFMTNPVAQLRWCHNYATSRYGSWQAAYEFWLENGWW